MLAVVLAAHRRKGSKLIALVPAYESAATIGAVIAGVAEQGLDVLVVDDGSRDGTADVARRAGARVLRHDRNRGKGWALQTGFRWALSQGVERVLTLDADGQHDPIEIPRFVARAEEADLVIGQRRLTRELMPASRIVGNRVSSFFIGLFCGGVSLPDTQCGYRLYARRLLMRIPVPGGKFEAETELLMRAVLLGSPVRWVPIATLYPTAEGPPGPGGATTMTHFDSLRDTLRIIRLVLLDSPRYPRASAEQQATRDRQW